MEEDNKEEKVKWFASDGALLCCICDMPSAWGQMLHNRLVRVTGTFRIAGAYQDTSGKVLEKVYAHYPDCTALKINPWRIVI